MGRYIQLKCFNCDPRYYKPGHQIHVDSEGYCTSCGRSVMDKECKDLDSKVYTSGREDYYGAKLKRWDTYFHKICEAISSKSPCLSRQIGAILVRDKSIVSTGYNGPARGYPHCGRNQIQDFECPRHAQGFKSGEGLHLCPAAHAEGNCIANAARNGVVTVGTTLYMNCIIPCKDCSILLVNAGIKEIVIDDATPYHEMSIEILKKGNIKIREFNL